MGQRFQSVFILPHIDMGTTGLNDEPNPNNRQEKVLVFHNQWLYGKGALNVNLLIIERLREAIKNKDDHGEFAKTQQGYKNHFLESDLNNAIKWASVQELNRETRFDGSHNGFIYGTDSEKKLSECLNYQDNNNGFFICEIQENINIKYCFISGLEDTEENENKTPQEYLKLFYSDEELKKDGSLKDMQKIFKRFDKFTQTPKEDFKITLKEMNKEEEEED